MYLILSSLAANRLRIGRDYGEVQGRTVNGMPYVVSLSRGWPELH